MTRYLSILIQILPSVVMGSLNMQFVVNKNIKLPSEINKYKLIRDLSSRNRHFAVGLYEDKKGKVIIKIWEGKVKDLHYFALEHQIKLTKVLTNVQKRMEKNKKLTIRVPSYVDSKQKHNQLIFISEYVQGDSLEKFSKSENIKWSIYLQCLNFLKDVSTFCTDEERKVITTKTLWDFIFLYPLINIAAIIMHPRYMFKILKGAIIFYSGILGLRGVKADRIIHGDLHPDNILVSKNSKFLIDIEQARFSYPDYEMISSAALKGNSKEFKRKVVKMLFSKRSKLNKKLSLCLVVNNSIHNLSGDKDKLGVKSYLWMLDQAFNINKKIL